MGPLSFDSSSAIDACINEGIFHDWADCDTNEESFFDQDIAFGSFSADADHIGNEDSDFGGFTTSDFIEKALENESDSCIRSIMMVDANGAGAGSDDDAGLDDNNNDAENSANEGSISDATRESHLASNLLGGFGKNAENGLSSGALGAIANGSGSSKDGRNAVESVAHGSELNHQ